MLQTSINAKKPGAKKTLMVAGENTVTMKLLLVIKPVWISFG